MTYCPTRSAAGANDEPYWILRVPADLWTANDAIERLKTERDPYGEAPPPSPRERGPESSSLPPSAPGAANAIF